LNFKPGLEMPSETAFKFLKLPINLQVQGTYGQIAAFFDRVTHLDLLVRVTNVELTPAASDKNKEEDVAAGSKEIIELHAMTTLMVFRALSDSEAETVQQALGGGDKKADKKGKKNKAKADVSAKGAS
jgi:Tfp pilus assembly protein PilO